jgi:hypothetical protein
MSISELSICIILICMLFIFLHFDFDIYKKHDVEKFLEKYDTCDQLDECSFEHSKQDNNKLQIQTKMIERLIIELMDVKYSDILPIFEDFQTVFSKYVKIKNKTMKSNDDIHKIAIHKHKVSGFENIIFLLLSILLCDKVIDKNKYDELLDTTYDENNEYYLYIDISMFKLSKTDDKIEFDSCSQLGLYLETVKIFKNKLIQENNLMEQNIVLTQIKKT